jgi:hypothetical protein
MKMDKLELVLQKIVRKELLRFELPENFHDVSIDIYTSDYGVKYCHITFLFEKPFKGEDSDFLFRIGGNEIIPTLETLLPNVDFIKKGNISTSNSTIDSYNNRKWWYDEQKKREL